VTPCPTAKRPPGAQVSGAVRSRGVPNSTRGHAPLSSDEAPAPRHSGGAIPPGCRPASPSTHACSPPHAHRPLPRFLLGPLPIVAPKAPSGVLERSVDSRVAHVLDRVTRQARYLRVGRTRTGPLEHSPPSDPGSRHGRAAGGEPVRTPLLTRQRPKRPDPPAACPCPTGGHPSRRVGIPGRRAPLR
jgi:hypothetical protein